MVQGTVFTSTEFSFCHQHIAGVLKPALGPFCAVLPKEEAAILLIAFPIRDLRISRS